MIQVKAKDLYKAIHAVKRTEFSTLPILNHAKIALADNGMTVTTTNLEKRITETVEYWGNGERWETCVPMTVKIVPNFRNKFNSPRKFYPFHDWVKVMAEYGETIEFTFDAKIQILTARCDGSKTEFKCMDALEFPTC